MEYVPHTDDDIAKALLAIGVERIEDLFADLPEELRNPVLDIPAGMDEVELLDHLRHLAAKNDVASPSFLGGGVRSHFIPSVTPHLALQGEFVTAYTPYQPEVSQGILQATFEYQTMMSELTGLPVSNASMYDGATAVAEAALLALRHTKRSTVVVSRGVHPESRQVLETYLSALGAELQIVDLEGLTTPEFRPTNDTACIIVQQPNFLGYLEAMPALAAATSAAGALFIAVVDPLSLAVLNPPGAYGAHIAVGEGQVLGNPVSFGGPHFGFMVVDNSLLRQMPGRLVGQTTDLDGRRAFTLTLQAREQHIRRSKAKSNICTNHQLTALMATVNMAALGPTGLAEIATASVHKSHELASALRAAGAEVAMEATFFNEFMVRITRPPEDFRHDLAACGLRAGVPVPDEFGVGSAILLAATELTKTADIEALAAAFTDLGEVVGGREVFGD